MQKSIIEEFEFKTPKDFSLALWDVVLLADNACSGGTLERADRIRVRKLLDEFKKPTFSKSKLYPVVSDIIPLLDQLLVKSSKELFDQLLIQTRKFGDVC